MDTQHHTSGAIPTTLSIFSTILAWLSFKDAQVIFGFAASVAAIVSAVFAIRYYYFATKKLKKQ